MEFDGLRRVMETDSGVTVEEMLRKGWKLLDTASGTRNDGEAYFLYSLGEFSDL